MRDVLMRLGVHGLIQPRWTAAIHEEWMAAVLRERPDLNREQLERTRRLMDLHAADSLVSGYEGRIENLQLPDPDDRHVLAAALEAEAETIVTWNVRHFPAVTLEPLGVGVATPDVLLLSLLKSGREEVLAVLRETRGSLKNPPVSAADYLEILRVQGLGGFCAAIAVDVRAV